MSDRWMEERERRWRERGRNQTYGRGQEEDYGRGDYRQGEGRSFSSYEREGRYGARPGSAERPYGQGETDAGYASRYGETYGDQDYRLAGGYGGERFSGRQDYRYGEAAYEPPTWRERAREERSFEGPETRDYYRAGYTNTYAPDTARGRDERSRQDGGRGFLDRAADQVASWFGAGREGERHDGRHGHRGKGPKGYRRSDARIAEDVNDHLTDDPWLDATEVEVAVASGEVTLTGTVADREAKHRAERCVERVPGVQHVQNNLRIGEVAGSRPFESGGNPLTSPGRGFGDNILDAQARGETGKEAKREN